MQTFLYPEHVDLQAKMVDFGGWQMPLQYRGIIAEHNAVRTHAGLFDVSHMGLIHVTGRDALRFLDSLSTNSLSGKAPYSATYTVFCNEEGGAIDDLIVYQIHPEHFFLVVNASNRQKDLEHLQKYAPSFQVELISQYDTHGILSLQGPESDKLLKLLFPELPPLKTMHFACLENDLIISHTGYTGERGFEFYAPKEQIIALWSAILKTGKHYLVEPCGLGARDVLRLEMGYALYGHELTEEISPLESVAAWTVKLENRDFLGKGAMINKLHSGKKLLPVALLGKERAPAREKYAISHQRQIIGSITSGTFSPTLQRPIALGLINEAHRAGETLEVWIRNTPHPFEIVKHPFITRPT